MKFAKKNDIIIIAGLLVISAVFWLGYGALNQGKQAEAEIYYGSKLVMTVDLGKREDRTFSVPENDHVVFHLYEDGSIRFEESDCPDKVCIRSGRLSVIGSSAACLPNKLILKLVAKDQSNSSGVDLIIGR